MLSSSSDEPTYEQISRELVNLPKDRDYPAGSYERSRFDLLVQWCWVKRGHSFSKPVLPVGTPAEFASALVDMEHDLRASKIVCDALKAMVEELGV